MLMSRNDNRPVLQGTFMEGVIGCAEQILDRLSTIEGNKPVPGMRSWNDQVLNVEFEKPYRKNNPELFKMLANEYGWGLMQEVLAFHYLRDGNAITKAHVKALAGAKPRMASCQVRPPVTEARRACGGRPPRAHRVALPKRIFAEGSVLGGNDG